MDFSPSQHPLFAGLAEQEQRPPLPERRGRGQAPGYALSRSDAVEWLRTLADASVDLVITDPPYESLEKHRKIGTTTRLKHSKASSNDWFSIFPNARFGELFAELYRVLRRDRHFYLFCDQETMFAAKPAAEQAGFRFWKPIVWDKCLAPDTLVWTQRGVVSLGDVRVGDAVATPRGTLAPVLATRRVRAPGVRIAFSDGTHVVASADHRFVRSDGELVEAAALRPGTRLMSTALLEETRKTLPLAALIPEADAIYELSSPERCLWCGRQFDSSRAAAAHQARFCEHARSKADLAASVGVSAKRMRRWLSSGQVPAKWAGKLGLSGKLTRRVRLYLQNDAGLWYPETIPLDYRWGKLVGLFAAEGSYMASGVTFALHAGEKHLHAHIARMVRSVGAKAIVHPKSDNGVTVDVGYKLIALIMKHFVGGRNAVSKHFLPTVYSAPEEFRRGVFDGLIEGDGHWSHDEQRETFVSASADLAMFVHRSALERGFDARFARVENECRGAWKVRFDPARRNEGLVVASVEQGPECELVDAAIDDPDELYTLANGLVTHNCRLGMGYHYRSRYELILFFEKGKRKLNDLSVPDIIEHPRIHRGYPAEKPAAVSEVLIRQSTERGELVIDPFMGSGSAGVAAAGLGRGFLGNDISPVALEIAAPRLEQAGASLAERLYARARR